MHQLTILASLVIQHFGFWHILAFHIHFINIRSQRIPQFTLTDKLRRVLLRQLLVPNNLILLPPDLTHGLKSSPSGAQQRIS